MNIISSQTSEKIMDLLKDKDYLLVGEIHGVKENALLLKEFVDLVEQKANLGFVGFEYYRELQPIINSLPKTQSELLNHHLVASMKRDGRFSDTHLEVIKTLVDKGIPIVCFDPPILSDDWNTRDKGMADLILENKKRFSKNNSKTIIICGNMHSKTKEFETNFPDLAGIPKKYHHIPLGSLIHSQLNIRLNYLSGEYFNFSQHSFDLVKPHSTQLWHDENDQWYLDIPKAHAAQ